MYFYLLLTFSFYITSVKEPYYGCTDIKPLLLLLLLLLVNTINSSESGNPFHHT